MEILERIIPMRSRYRCEPFNSRDVQRHSVGSLTWYKANYFIKITSTFQQIHSEIWSDRIASEEAPSSFDRPGHAFTVAFRMISSAVDFSMESFSA